VPDPTPHLRRAAIAAAAAVLVVSSLACSSSKDASPPSTAAVAPGLNSSLPAPSGRALPPNDLVSLQQLYDPVLAPLGMHLTRAALVDRSNGGYEKSDEGTHLALYVRRTNGTDTPDTYADGMWTLAALFSPDVFSRWPGLQTYDVCQEITDAAPAEGDEPPTASQVQATREGAAKIDWRTGSLVDVLAAARSGAGVEYVVNNAVKESPAFQAAETAALARLGQTPASGPATSAPIPSTTVKRVYG